MFRPRVRRSVVVVRRCGGPGGVLALLPVALLLVVLLLVHVVLMRRVATVHGVLQRLGVAVEIALVPVRARLRAGACVTAHVGTVTASRTPG